ncbi:MAG: beta-propeller fold lactonase family protein [Bacteroidaceae bacterium]|jgi:YVTN family beta-propeller protein|nr:beta-propeller fold lactonase family protein [Bacteroidaceae bacterium]
MTISKSFLLALSFVALSVGAQTTKKNTLPVVHPKMGITAVSSDNAVQLKLVAQRQNFGGPKETRDDAINSPKSANVHPSNKKYYVNSLEGGTTVVFEMGTNRRLKVISHRLNDSHAHLWGASSSLYPFTHYPKSNNFMGKPVESTFSHNGRYLWVPYYRRSYDVNAQDPSAVAIIDTETDEIVRLMETGPLPKMIATSHNGKYVAISHWGNNTVGLINIESSNPKEWRHTDLLVVDYVLPLNYSKTVPVDRDNGSGYALRGTVFTPDDRYLIVGCMGGGGGIAVIDMQTKKYLGRVQGMMFGVRHLIIVGDYLYLSVNSAGYVQRIKLSKFLEAATSPGSKTTKPSDWENCKVGAGARTIEASPNGKYIFVACNNASKLHVVDTRTMKTIASIDVDSYPVGLDVSEDGRYVIVTSQGRKGFGGNAVNIYEVKYNGK